MMAARILSGKEYAAKIKEAAKREADSLGICPGLAVVMVGDNPASAVYVRNKNKACEELGFRSLMETLPADTSKDELLSVIDRLNADGNIHGILVQLPRPAALADAEQEVLNRISPDKDVDGFHPVNVGRLSTGQDALAPCTPAGCVRMLEYADIPMDGKNAVIIGRSNIVGKPMAMLMLRENATVTVCHSKTKNLKEVCKRADILIVAIGKPKLIDSSYIKEGAVVIDVGIHRMEDGKLCGDVDYEDAAPHCSAITPVPGGVGPMTIAMLMSNCVHG